MAGGVRPFQDIATCSRNSPGRLLTCIVRMHGLTWLLAANNIPHAKRDLSGGLDESAGYEQEVNTRRTPPGSARGGGT